MMQSMSPIKSLRLLTSPPKKFDETGNKGVVTSVHGINNEFSNFSVEGRKRSQLQANFRHKSIQIYNRGIKTISLEMPVLGLERAVVYPKNKISKLQLKKRILKKISHSDHQIPSSNNFEKIRESNKDMKCERKSVTFLNTEITIDDQKMIQEELMRTKYSIKNSPRIASDTMLHKKYHLNELYKDNLKLPSNDMIMKGSKSKPHQTKELSLKDVSVVPNIINNQPQTINQPSTCESRKYNQEGIEKRSSFESKIPKFKRFVKRLQRIKSEDGEIQTDCKATHSKASVTINNELKSVDTMNKPKSRSKTSQVSDTETMSVQLSQTVSKSSQNSTQTNQSLASVSTIKERSSKVKTDVADVKKTGEKARLYNKNNKKKPSVITPVKAKVATKPIKEIKSVINESPINKKAYTTSNRNMKKR